MDTANHSRPRGSWYLDGCVEPLQASEIFEMITACSFDGLKEEYGAKYGVYTEYGHVFYACSYPALTNVAQKPPPCLASFVISLSLFRPLFTDHRFSRSLCKIFGNAVELVVFYHTYMTGQGKSRLLNNNGRTFRTHSYGVVTWVWHPPGKAKDKGGEDRQHGGP